MLLENFAGQRLHANASARFFSMRACSACCCSERSARFFSACRSARRRLTARRTSSCCFAIQFFFACVFWMRACSACWSARFLIGQASSFCFAMRAFWACCSARKRRSFAMRASFARVFSMPAFMTPLLNGQSGHALTCALIGSEYNH